ncbi:MAG: hypothetical protein JO007_06900, partial [Alphaproteobacteria bacterium]|nr:hypothetical protein [Alphaproteobacteria bacterium]
MKPGLSSYSVEGGSVRQLYGLFRDDYIGWAGSGSLRHGISNWLTLESHVEASSGLDLGGVGADIEIGTLGVLTTAIAASSGRGRPPFGLLPGAAPGPGHGGLAAASFARQSPAFNIAASATVASAGYRDIAAVNGTPVPRAILTTSLVLLCHFFIHRSPLLPQAAGTSGQRGDEPDGELTADGSNRTRHMPLRPHRQPPAA